MKRIILEISDGFINRLKLKCQLGHLTDLIPLTTEEVAIKRKGFKGDENAFEIWLDEREANAPVDLDPGQLLCLSVLMAAVDMPYVQASLAIPPLYRDDVDILYGTDVYVAAVGDSWDGITLYGPFYDSEGAEGFCESVSEEWHIVGVHDPTADRDPKCEDDDDEVTLCKEGEER